LLAADLCGYFLDGLKVDDQKQQIWMNLLGDKQTATIILRQNDDFADQKDERGGG
jgi:hypothetical protein